MSLADRFWAKVNKNGPIPEYRPDLGPCWIWTASIGTGGYGQIGTFRPSGYTMIGAHVAAYEIATGYSVPEGKELDHLCRVRACVRFSHLEPVTARINLLRGFNWASEKANQTHCIRGHLFDELNTKFRRNGSRRCRLCVRIRSKTPEQRAKHAADMRMRRRLKHFSGQVNQRGA
jgi:hypothetical protein